MQTPTPTLLTAADKAEGYNFVDKSRLDIDGENPKMQLKGLQAKATLPQHRDWQTSNPELAVLGKYRNQHTMPQSLGYRMGSGITNWAGSNNIVNRGFSGGALPAGLIGAVLGAGAGGVLGLLGQRKNEHISPARMALMLGVLGGGYGAYRGYQNRKSASWREGSQQAIIDELRSAQGLSFSERANLMQGVRKLPPQQAERLANMLGASFGAGTAAIVAKFLLGAGLGGTLFAGLVGGVVGRTLFGGAPKNALGQNSLNNHSIFGNPI